MRHAIGMALRNPRSAGLSDREIGRHVGCDGKTVASVRAELSAEIPQMDRRTVTRGGTTYKEFRRVHGVWEVQCAVERLGSARWGWVVFEREAFSYRFGPDKSEWNSEPLAHGCERATIADDLDESERYIAEWRVERRAIIAASASAEVA